MQLIKMVAGEYKDQQGTTKPNWVTVGQLIEKGDRKYVKIFATLSTPEVFCSVFDTEKKATQDPAEGF